MSISFYFDEHVHGAITRTLQARGVDVITVQDDGLAGDSDAHVLVRANALGRILVSNDADMLEIAVGYQRAGTVFNGLLFLTRAPLREHVDSLELISLLATVEEVRNGIWYLPL